MTPRWELPFIRPVTLASFSTRSATRAATDFRKPTCPARLAMRSPSTATGITMAINASAASTSTSVNAEAGRPYLAARDGRVVGLNFIGQAIGGLHDSNRMIIPLRQCDPFRAGFADKTVGQKTNHWQAARDGHGLLPLAHGRAQDWHRGLKAQIFVEDEINGVLVLVKVAGGGFQSVGSSLGVEP